MLLILISIFCVKRNNVKIKRKCFMKYIIISIIHIFFFHHKESEIFTCEIIVKYSIAHSLFIISCSFPCGSSFMSLNERLPFLFFSFFSFNNTKKDFLCYFFIQIPVNTFFPGTLTNNTLLCNVSLIRCPLYII